MPITKFRCFYAKSFIRDLKRLDQSISQKIIKEIENKLLSNPYNFAKKLRGQEVGQWRFRVGVYRIRFDISGNTLYYYRVRHRREIYK